LHSETVEGTVLVGGVGRSRVMHRAPGCFWLWELAHMSGRPHRRFGIFSMSSVESTKHEYFIAINEHIGALAFVPSAEI
jgi:hypothetical protein